MGLSHSPRIVTDGLVFCVDAGDKMSYPGAGTTWTDLSKNRSNGTLTNGPTFDSANGGSIVFDGTNDYVDFGSQVANLSTSTISFWINYNVLGSTHNSPIGYDANPYDYVILFWSDNIYYRADVSRGGEHGTINAGSWYNFTMTRDSSYIRFYKNNNLLHQHSPIDLGETINIEWIGRGYVYDNAKISLVHVYNRALSAAEITQNYNATRGRFQ